MTSLIDVIFLLLLFFMLTSTFSRFSEVPLPLGGAGTAVASTQDRLFLRVAETEIRLNGQLIALDALPDRLSSDTLRQVLISMTETASAQRLTDILTQLRGVQNIAINVLVPT